MATTVLGVGALGAGLVADPGEMVPFVAPVVLVVVWTWAAYWRPAVIVTPAGVELRNVTRTVHLPWPTITLVDTRFALTLHTAYGAYSAWAAPAPSRSRVVNRDQSELRHLPQDLLQDGTIGPGDLPSSASGAAALIIRRRWAELRDAGLLDDPKVEHRRPQVTWHTATLVALGVLLAASVAVPLIR